MPASLAPALASADPTAAPDGSAEEGRPDGGKLAVVSSCGEPDCGALASILQNVQPAELVAEPEASAQPASASQEIFERKGWNEMDSSGWKPWRPW